MFRTVKLVEPKSVEQLKAVFDKHRREWLAQGHSGEFTVVTEAGAHGFFETYEAAFVSANHQFGCGSYLIQEVLVEDRVGSIPYVLG